MYCIIRKFYRPWKLNNVEHYKEITHPFTPLTLEEATIIKSKLCPPAHAIDHITLIETKE